MIPAPIRRARADRSGGQKSAKLLAINSRIAYQLHEEQTAPPGPADGAMTIAVPLSINDDVDRRVH